MSYRMESVDDELAVEIIAYTQDTLYIDQICFHPLALVTLVTWQFSCSKSKEKIIDSITTEIFGTPSWPVV